MNDDWGYAEKFVRNGGYFVGMIGVAGDDKGGSITMLSRADLAKLPVHVFEHQLDPFAVRRKSGA